MRIQPDDLLSVLIGPGEGNPSCDLTDVDFRPTSASETPPQWSLTADGAGNVVAVDPQRHWTGAQVSCMAGTYSLNDIAARG
jgi:hypothetical protein